MKTFVNNNTYISLKKTKKRAKKFLFIYIIKSSGDVKNNAALMI